MHKILFTDLRFCGRILPKEMNWAKPRGSTGARGCLRAVCVIYVVPRVNVVSFPANEEFTRVSSGITMLILWYRLKQALDAPISIRYPIRVFHFGRSSILHRYIIFFQYLVQPEVGQLLAEKIDGRLTYHIKY